MRQTYIFQLHLKNFHYEMAYIQVHKIYTALSQITLINKNK